MSGPSAMSLARVLLLIRHGEYLTDAPMAEGKTLTPCGKMQAKLTARTLMSTCMSDKPPIEKIIPSTMVRAQQTANIVHDHPKLVGIPLEDKDLQEGSPEQAHTVERFEQMFQKYFVPAGQTSITSITYSIQGRGVSGL